MHTHTPTHFTRLCRVLAAIMAVAAGLVSLAVPPPAAALPIGFVVNSADDAVSPGDDALTLREAIHVANGELVGAFSEAERVQLEAGGCGFAPVRYRPRVTYRITTGCGALVPDRIGFAPDVTEIMLKDSLPELTDAGTTISGESVFPLIDGSGMAPGGEYAFYIAAHDITISNLAIANVPEVPGSDANAAIYVDPRAHAAEIRKNTLGTLPNARTCTESGLKRNATYGIMVAPNEFGLPGDNNGVAYIAGNTIGCHHTGVAVIGADYVYVGEERDGKELGNTIGRTWEGDPLPQRGAGVLLHTNGTGDGVRYGVVRHNAIAYSGTGISVVGNGPVAPVTGHHAIERNHVHSNFGIGIDLSDGVQETIIAGNAIGTDQSGDTALPNGGYGIQLKDTASTKVNDNLISGNLGHGLVLDGAMATDVRGNRIGTNSAGDAAIANHGDGVALLNRAAFNAIGTGNEADRNVISGNQGHGVTLLGDGTSDNAVEGNYIGVNGKGTDAVPNGEAGVMVDRAHSNRIGAAHGDGVQLISGNRGAGIKIVDAHDTTVGEANCIGTQYWDPRVVGSGAPSGCVEPRPNGGAGVAVEDDGAIRNRIVPQVVAHNKGLAIDLKNDGPTANDYSGASTGPNILLHHPIVVGEDDRSLHVMACADCELYFYAQEGDARAEGGGGRLLFTGRTDSLGEWKDAIPATFGVVPQDIVMVAVDKDGNTSELGR